MPQTLNTLFRWCNDIDTMRHFYSECLQLTETFYRNDDEHGWLTYQLGEVQLVFTRTLDTPLPVAADFALNPAYDGGSVFETSWVIQVEAAQFQPCVEQIKSSGYATYQDAPFSNRPGHLQFIARDPMGMTIEIYTVVGSETNGDETAV